MRFCLGISVYTAAAVAAICAAPSHSASAQDADAKPVSIDVLDVASMTVPATFKKTQPRSRIIQHEFKVGEGEKPARLTFMAAGGGVTPNIKRWKGQFSGGDPDEQKTETMEVGKFEVHLVDVSGSYSESMGGGPFAPGKRVQRENYAMAGAILVAPNQRLYFANLIGPAKIVKANREKFVEMIKTVGK